MISIWQPLPTAHPAKVGMPIRLPAWRETKGNKSKPSLKCPVDFHGRKKRHPYFWLVDSFKGHPSRKKGEKGATGQLGSHHSAAKRGFSKLRFASSWDVSVQKTSEGQHVPKLNERDNLSETKAGDDNSPSF